jgi:hypothetical protein
MEAGFELKPPSAPSSVEDILDFAVSIDGYSYAERVLGAQLTDLFEEQLTQYRQTGRWSGSLEELRCWLFAEARRVHFDAYYPSGTGAAELFDLYGEVCRSWTVMHPTDPAMFFPPPPLDPAGAPRYHYLGTVEELYGERAHQPIHARPADVVQAPNEDEGSVSGEEAAHALPADAVWVPGSPAVYLGAGESAWKKLLGGCGFMSSRPAMIFTVSSWKRYGNWFDLDNLTWPVISALTLVPDSIWSTVRRAEPVGVTLWEQGPPAVDHEIAFARHIAQPPLSSQAGIPALIELEGASVLGRAEPLGLELTFDDPAAPIGNFGFNGPVKPMIDALGPLLGWHGSKKGGPADHRIHDLRVRRGKVPGSHGAQLRLWYLEERHATSGR